MLEKNEIVSVRMSILDLKRMQALALVDDDTLAGEMRRAITEYIEKHKSEPDFQKALEDAKKRENAFLDLLRPVFIDKDKI